MKQYAAVANAIRTRHEIKALPELTAEFNLNRYVPCTASNTPSEDAEGNDIEMFPIESIVEPIRPTKGINKARVNYGTVADDYQNASTPRYYISSMDDTYKYWMSPYASDGVGNISGANPQVIYSSKVATNKIVIGLENSWASPINYEVQVTSNGGLNWAATVAPPIGNDGRMVLYWTGSSWSPNKPASMTATTEINGIRLVVTRLGGGIGIDGSPSLARIPGGQVVSTTGAGSYLSVIEMGARLVVDFSEKVVGVDDTFDAGDSSQLTPIGTITTNSGDIDLWDVLDVPGGAPYANYLEPNVEMNLRYVYHLDGQTYPVQQFKMYTDNWSENTDKTYTVTVSDASKYLKEIKPRPGKYEDMTLSQIVYRLLDGAGFTDYNIFDNPNTVDYRIPVFWVTGEQTVWEIFDELATATQSLIYFDAWGKLNVKTREDAFNPAAPVTWNLRRTTSGSELADIVSLDNSGEYGANVVKVIYKTAQWADEVNGFTEYSTVWTPEDTLVVRASPLVRNLPEGNTTMYMSPTEAAVWPYEGLVQIEGELIRYDAKMFVYRDGGQWNWRWVSDQDEYDKFNEKTPVGNRWQNHFDGRFRITERGAWNTEDVTHSVEASGYDIRRYGPNNVVDARAGFHHNREFSTVTLSHDGMLNGPQDFLVATRGSSNDTGWRHFGTKMKFSKFGGVDQRGGIMFNSVGNRDGYYVELTPSVRLSDKEKQQRREVALYVVKNGTRHNVLNGKGAGAAIVDERWHTIDVFYNQGDQRVAVWIDGKKYINEHIPGGQQITPNGKFGMFIRGRTVIDYEYLYAIARGDEPEPGEDFSSFNRVTGLEEGNSLVKEWVFKWRKRRRVKKKTIKQKHRFNQQYMDEFGPYVHEIREFDVKFDPAPVQHSKLYMSNDWNAMLLEYRANAFGAKFAIANTGRGHAILNGEDSSIASGTGETVAQQMFVFGRALVIGEQEEIIERNEQQIKARGEIVTEVSSDWIQTEGAAKALARWIKSHWSKGADEVTVEVFGNPLFEVGDLVAVEHSEKRMALNTHQYFVTSISTSFDAGIVTSLTLRRKN